MPQMAAVPLMPVVEPDFEEREVHEPRSHVAVPSLEEASETS